MEDGVVRTCCEGKSVIADLKTDSVDCIENSAVLARIRDRMQAGRPDPNNCISCMLKEKKDGVAPLRQYYQTYFPKIKNQLKFIDVRWNNTCNLGCIYCSPMFSSVWADRLSQQNTSQGNSIKMTYWTGCWRELSMWMRSCWLVVSPC